MARISFVGLADSFDYYHIGGMDSLARRLAIHLAEMGDQVEFVHYCADQEKSERPCNGITLRYFENFNRALDHLVASRCNHVVSIYLKPRDRLAYARFRRARGSLMRFHHIYSCWNESRLKRELFFVEARLFPFNGTLFCLSPRIYRYVSSWSPGAALLLPPVSDNFFCRPKEKTNGKKLHLTYAGRVDRGKGTGRAVEVFERLGNRDDVKARICGFAWSHRPETMALHKRLMSNPNIRYEPTEYKGWSPEVDENLCRLLRETDILLLPYQKLSSTIDTPLLLLEGMASLCAVLTPPLGDLHETYGEGNMSLQGHWSTDAAMDVIDRARGCLAEERERLYERSSALSFGVNQTTIYLRRQLLD